MTPILEDLLSAWREAEGVLAQLAHRSHYEALHGAVNDVRATYGRLVASGGDTPANEAEARELIGRLRRLVELAGAGTEGGDG